MTMDSATTSTARSIVTNEEIRAGLNEKSMDMVKLLLHQKASPIMAYTPDRTLVYVNAAYDALFADRFPNGTLGRDITTLEPEKAHLIEEMVQVNLARKPGDPDLVIESPSVDANGENHWFEWRCMHSFDKAGNVQLVVAMSRDLTAQRLAEQRTQRVAERLEESNRDLLEFAQVASHDLQEPLRKVTAFSGRLQANLEGQLDDRSADYMQRMNGAVGRMQNLIDDLLTFARVNTRGTAMVDTPLKSVVENVLTDLEIAIEESGAEFAVDSLPTLPVDASQLGQLFQNLIGNAIKFRREGVPPRIAIKATHVPSTSMTGDEPVGGWFDVTVSDNGIGFDNKYAQKIFAPFQRLHSRSEFEGTGVGLSVCRRIAERHQGTIAVKSLEGEGTTFVLRLPTSHLDVVPVGGDVLDADQSFLDIEHTIIDGQSHA